MYFKNIITSEKIKILLYTMYRNNHIPHALFFEGPSGYGGLPLAVAYSRMILNNKKDPKLNIKIDKLNHLDLHFIFPISNITKIQNSIISIDFLTKWKKFFYKYPYGNLFNWLDYAKIDNKKAKIGIEEVKYIIKTLQVKSYEGGYIILIIWMPERLNIIAANKLLKIIEEPPKKTIFLFVGEQKNNLLPTLISRMYIIKLKPLSLYKIKYFLQKENKISENQSLFIAKQSEGNWGEALNLLEQIKENEFENFFILWIRNIFMAKKYPSTLKNLIKYSEELHKWGKERQKKFLDYSINIFRQALLGKYLINSINFNPFNSNKFNWKSFLNYINIINVQKIFKEINEASIDIDQNANTKIVFLNISINIIQHLHQKK